MTLEDMDDIITFVSRLENALVLRPQAGDGSPSIAWDDVFFYYSTDGRPPRTQPFATIVTKNYPDDARSRLDRPGAFRLNIAVGRAVFTHVLGFEPQQIEDRDIDYAARDVLMPHPLYGSAGWLAVVNPSTTTPETLLETAYHRQRARLTGRT